MSGSADLNQLRDLVLSRLGAGALRGGDALVGYSSTGLPMIRVGDVSFTADPAGDLVVTRERGGRIEVAVVGEDRVARQAGVLAPNEPGMN